MKVKSGAFTIIKMIESKNDKVFVLNSYFSIWCEILCISLITQNSRYLKYLIIQLVCKGYIYFHSTSWHGVSK